MLRLLFLLIVMVVIAATGLQAKIWYVFPDGSGDAPTIQAAVDSSATGDQILIEGGQYYEENIVIDGKDVLLDASSGVIYIIAPTHGSGTGFVIRNVTAGFTLNSFNISGYAAAVVIEDASPGVNFLTVTDCTEGIRITGAASAPYLTYTLIDSCSTGYEIQQGGGVTVQNHTIVNCVTGVRVSAGSVSLVRNIIYGSDLGLDCGGTVTLGCNNFYNNISDYSGCSPGATDFYTDPIFCFLTPPSPGEYYLHQDSPCLTRSNPCGVRIGTFTGYFGCTGKGVEGKSWGAIKLIYD